MSTAVESDPVMEITPLPEHKPAFLNRVQIRNYKSIAFCDVTLEPLTLLVGRNGSGKSNFLDALGFLADLMDDSLSDAISTRGGWRSIICKSSRFRGLEFKLYLNFPSFHSEWTAEYNFGIECDSPSSFRFTGESLTLHDQANNRKIGYAQDSKGFKWIGETYFKEGVFDDLYIPSPTTNRSGDSERLFLSSLGSQPFVDIIELLGKSTIHNFNPALMRLHQPFKAARTLSKSGDNLPYSLKALAEIDPNELARASSYLQSIVPDIIGFRIQEYGDYETIRFQFKTDQYNREREFDASSISDGTLRVLASLIASRQIVLPLGQGFIGIEEPETSLHPAAMQALVDALDEATLLKQIILTTHSSEMLDNPTIKPENVRVVRMVDGRTEIAPVDKVYHEIVRRELNTLGGLERENQLEPDFDDLERQKKLADASREAAA